MRAPPTAPPRCPLRSGDDASRHPPRDAWMSGSTAPSGPLVSTGTYWYVLVRTGTYWYVLVRTSAREAGTGARSCQGVPEDDAAIVMFPAHRLELDQTCPMEVHR